MPLRAGPDKLNGSVEAIFKLPSGTLLAGVASASTRGDRRIAIRVCGR